MHNLPVILASASPRRRELLSRLGIDFTVIPARGEERITSEDPARIVQDLAHQKAAEVLASQEVSEILAEQNADSALVIGADTIVVKDGRILGKPKDADDAFRMLCSLRDDVHQVYTGVSLILRDQEREQTVSFHEMTKVYFGPMTDAQIRAYIATGDPMDKAGAYGIQSGGGKYISRIEGDYENVVGLPVRRLEEELGRLGVRTDEKARLRALSAARKQYTPRPPVPKRENAVLLPLIETEDGYEILFEMRALDLAHQPGDICLPGGRIEDGEQPQEAAVREAAEELLIRKEQIRVLFPMDGMIGPGERTVWPFAALLTGYEGTFSAQEVDHTFRLPLSWFPAHPPKVYRGRRTTQAPADFPYERIAGGRDYWKGGYEYDILVYENEGTAIWGMTARVVDAFVRLYLGRSAGAPI